MNYVLGFAISNREDGSVVLINKNRPAWQRGCWNGVGGKIERKTAGHDCFDIVCDYANFDPCVCPWETPLEAMRREFREETGVDILTWRKFNVLKTRGGHIHCFYYIGAEALSARSNTDEEVRRFPLKRLPTNVIPNLKWLIPQALSMEADGATCFETVECYEKDPNSGWEAFYKREIEEAEGRAA